MGSRGSRSPSPEAMAAEGRRKSVSSVASVEERCGGSASAKTSADDGGEICLHGMSSDEDDDVDEAYESQEEDDDDCEDLERNVVASVIKGGGGGAFASPGASKTGSMEAFGTPSGMLDLFVEEGPSTSSRLRSRASPLLRPVEVTRSPLLGPSAPPLELPSAAIGDGEGDGGLLPAAGDSFIGDGAAGCSSQQVEHDVQHLMEEMGELMCLLQQQQQELAIYSQEVKAEDLLEKLEHFRQVARNEELLPRHG